MMATAKTTTGLTPPAPLSLRDEGGDPTGSGERIASAQREDIALTASHRGRRRSGLAPHLSLALLLALLLAGCGGKDTIAGSTPEATADAFIDAMQAGEYDRVAVGFDYETDARRQNPDWDTFGTSQRNLIVGELQKRKAEELQSLAGMFSGEASVTDINKQPQTATAAITAGANTVILRMRLVEGTWMIAGMEEQTG